MARPSIAARRYAEAAFELAERDDAFEAWADGLGLVAAVAADENIGRIVDNPAISQDDREAIVSKLFEGRVAPGILNLCRLLARRGRFESLTAVGAEFTYLLNRRNGVVDAVITSASPLSSKETGAVSARVQAMTGASVSLRTEIDDALIGGITIKIGDQLLDASVRGRLERLRAQLVAGSR